MTLRGLIKATNMATRVDTIEDLRMITEWRTRKGLKCISPLKQTVRAIENAAALMLENIDLSDLPVLIRGVSFYLSIISDIKEKERSVSINTKHG